MLTGLGRQGLRRSAGNSSLSQAGVSAQAGFPNSVVNFNLTIFMDSPLVSAVVLCYNQARFAVECLEGIRQQGYPNLEIVVNDDASRDNSVEVIETWLKHSGIPYQLLRSTANQGICRSLNNAIRHARGKYISGIAADDVWLPGKLVSQVRLMESLPETTGVIYADALLMDEKSQPLPGSFIEADGRNRGFKEVPRGNIQLALWADNFIAPMTTLVRRECYERVGLFDETLFAEDWDMWLRIARHYQFAYSSEPVAKYRIVGTSATRARFGELLDDMCKTCLKHLRSGELDRQARRAAARRLHELASSSFVQRSPHHRKNLLQTLRYQPSFGIAGRLLLAACGSDPAVFERIRCRIKSVAPGQGAVSCK